MGPLRRRDVKKFSSATVGLTPLDSHWFKFSTLPSRGTPATRGRRNPIVAHVASNSNRNLARSGAIARQAVVGERHALRHIGRHHPHGRRGRIRDPAIIDRVQEPFDQVAGPSASDSTKLRYGAKAPRATVDAPQDAPNRGCSAPGPFAIEPRRFRRRSERRRTGDRASNARPAVRQLVQWQIAPIIGPPAASRQTAPHEHAIVVMVRSSSPHLRRWRAQ